MQVLPAGGGAAAGKCNNLPSLLGSGDQDSGEVSVRSGQWSAVSPDGQSSFYRFVSESEHSHFSTSSHPAHVTADTSLPKFDDKSTVTQIAD